MSVPEKVLMRKIKKREKTKLTVLKRREAQKGKNEPISRLDVKKIYENSKENSLNYL